VQFVPLSAEVHGEPQSLLNWQAGRVKRCHDLIDPERGMACAHTIHKIFELTRRATLAPRVIPVRLTPLIR
jgi:hypothetical protein